MSNESFIKEIAPYAQEIQASYYILASLIIAQACLESGYGTSKLATEAKNLFGTKGSYNGKALNVATVEHDEKGNEYTIFADFKMYPTWLESLEDLADKYKNGVSWDPNKYKAVIGCSNYKEAAQAVKDAGYATDISYVTKLTDIIEKYDLTKYDEIVIEAPKKLYYVQVGAYSSKENAERMAAQLTKAGFPAFIK
jgi:flagellum-specific peptidoglycan hydrolase FlgJ